MDTTRQQTWFVGGEASSAPEGKQCAHGGIGARRLNALEHPRSELRQSDRRFHRLVDKLVKRSKRLQSAEQRLSDILQERLVSVPKEGLDCQRLLSGVRRVKRSKVYFAECAYVAFSAVRSRLTCCELPDN